MLPTLAKSTPLGKHYRNVRNRRSCNSKECHQHQQTIWLQTIKYLQYWIQEDEKRNYILKNGKTLWHGMKRMEKEMLHALHLRDFHKQKLNFKKHLHWFCMSSWKMDLMLTELTCSQTSVLWSIDQVAAGRNSLGFLRRLSLLLQLQRLQRLVCCSNFNSTCYVFWH